jgi:hypothetical protein
MSGAASRVENAVARVANEHEVVPMSPHPHAEQAWRELSVYLSTWEVMQARNVRAQVIPPSPDRAGPRG